MQMRMALVAITIALSVTAGLCQPEAGPPVADEHTLLLAHFDETVSLDLAKGDATLEVSGAEVVAEGKWGGAVRLGEGQYLSFDPEGNLDMSAGTAMFWFKPDWQTPTGSHALLSMGLDGDPAGYFVLTQGWWETSGGAGRMYFVYDNQAYMHTSTAFLPTLGDKLNDWRHFAITWQEGTPGQCAIYIDGERMARSVKNCETVRRPRTRLFIGSDQAAGGGDTRPANGLLDELVILDRTLGQSEVAAAFAAQEPRWAEIQAEKWTWLTDTLAGPAPTFERDEQGRVLESRALLDEGLPWANPENIPTIVDKLKRAGFNVFIPCVWHGRGARYPHETEPMEGSLGEAYAALDVDPFAELVRQCHEAGIEVHPWFCVVKREQGQHPEFVEETTPGHFFDAHRPEFREFIVGLMVDFVRKYGVDGINLDYIRTGGLCKGPLCQAEYREKFGTELLDDVKLKTDAGWPNPNIVQWQDEAIGEIVRRLAEEGRAINPDLIISVDGHVHGPESAPDAFGRNERPWIEAGWVDVVYNMDYGEHLRFAQIDAIRESVGRPAAIVDLPGNYERTDQGKVVSREGQLVADQISYCQRKWPGNGVGLYLYSMLSEGQIEALRAGPFAEDAVPHWVR
jgi:uncharacterized lipoprotein YddW (UPF0748 family)